MAKPKLNVSTDPGEETLPVMPPLDENVTIASAESNSPSLGDDAETDPVTDMMQIINRLEDRIDELSRRVDGMERNPSALSNSVQSEEVVLPSHSAPEDIVATVTKFCSPEFEVRVMEQIPNKTFELTIIPPARLRESEDDRRLKILAHSEGLAGVEEFARLVFENCKAFAFKNGVRM